METLLCRSEPAASLLKQRRESVTVAPSHAVFARHTAVGTYLSTNYKRFAVLVGDIQKQMS